MPEAEELIADAARHATIYARELWRRHRGAKPEPGAVALRDVAQRLEWLIVGACGAHFPVRAAQAPAPPTFLSRVFGRAHGPRTAVALPATDGSSIWLPPAIAAGSAEPALEWYRIMAVQQAFRARLRAESAPWPGSPLERAVLTLLTARLADLEIERTLPGMRQSLAAFRQSMLAQRPPPGAFPAAARGLETLARAFLASAPGLPALDGPQAMAGSANRLAAALRASAGMQKGEPALYPDYWTGALLPPQDPAPQSAMQADAQAQAERPRSARMTRRPDVRKPADDEDDAKPGAWMVQTSQPHEQAEDPVGLQRPTDRDATTAAEDFADALSELPEARLVSTPGRPKEVLLSDDPPAASARRAVAPAAPAAQTSLWYPEWDYRLGGYREPGACVHARPAAQGPQAWVDRTLDAHRSLLNTVRRRFEMLRAQRVRMRKLPEGDDIDLDACIENAADFRAGLPLRQGLYQSIRPARRDLSVVLLIDISGSTDAWVSGDKRVIDVEREALLLVAIALQGMQAPYCILGFSGEGPGGVAVAQIKQFDETYSDTVARKIAGLEPEQYTRAGAAIRHATAALQEQGARHRLLLLLSDGKPNDIDDYEGRYGLEDMRQAIVEARLQGISPFCLTVDRQAPGYLPAVFGVHHYALLPRPELLPRVLLEWMKRLVTA